MMLLLLLFLVAVTTTTGCRLPPCSAANGDANFVGTDGCCATCRPGFRCNGTHAITCAPPAETQPFALQSRCRIPRNCTLQQFELKAPTSSTDRECRAFSSCITAVEFERIAPTTTSDRVCSILRTCDFAQEYEARAATLTSDRTCNKVTTCDTVSQLQIKAATPTTDAVCTCNEGFLMRSQCTSCDSLLPGCNTCVMTLNDTVTCTACKAGLQPTLTGGCVSCDTFNCAECLASNVCRQCKPGFIRTTDSQNGTISCVCNAANCDECTTNGTCFRCNTGYTSVSGQCVCEAKNCDQCNSAGQCTQCRLPFTEGSDGQCVCVLEHCNVCREDGSACLVCAFPFRATPTGECSCGISGCNTCNATGCAACRDGLSLADDQTCASNEASVSSSLTDDGVTAVIVAVVVGASLVVVAVLFVWYRRTRIRAMQHNDDPLYDSIPAHHYPPPLPKRPTDAFEEHQYEFPASLHHPFSTHGMTIGNPVYDSASRTPGPPESDIADTGPLYDLGTIPARDEYIMVQA